MGLDVTLVVPTIPERRYLRLRALKSAREQTIPFANIIVVEAQQNEDAASARNRGLSRVQTSWVSFLDDDDELEVNHLECLINDQESSAADIVYPWFTAYEHGRAVPEAPGMLQLNGHTALGVPWGAEQQHALKKGSWCFHLTALFRTKLLHDIGGFRAPARGCAGEYLSEDVDLEQRLVAVGANVHHCPRRTWRWHFWDGRTKGQPVHLR